VLLAQGQVYHGDPAEYKIAQERSQAATAATVLDAAARWISKGDYTLTVRAGQTRHRSRGAGR
jgi:hypothetical protein